MTPPVDIPKHGPSVIAGVIQRLSVSQLKRHKLCPRAWFFQKVMRVPEPSTGAQQVGTEGHAQLEHFLVTGEDVLGTFARSGAHLLPTPGPDLLVEQPLNGEPPLTAGGIPFTGFIDLVDARRLASDGVLRITDHKFTSNVATNAASAEQLADADTEPGLQMVGYGAWALSQVERFPGLRTLELEHLYYQTRGQRLAASVVATVPAEHLAHEWQTKVEPQVEAMKEHAQAARASDVPANYGPACGKYGGCPFMAKCLTGENKTMSLRDKLLNKASESAPLTVAAVERNATELPAVLPPDAPAPTPAQTAPEVAQATEQPAPKRRGRPRKVAESEQPTDASPSPASALRVRFGCSSSTASRRPSTDRRPSRLRATSTPCIARWPKRAASTTCASRAPTRRSGSASGAGRWPWRRAPSCPPPAATSRSGSPSRS